MRNFEALQQSGERDDINSLTEKLEQAQKNASFLQKLNSVQERFLHNNAELAQAKASVAEKNNRKESLELQKKPLQEKIARGKQSISDLETLLHQQRRIESLEDHRNALQHGEECPLCGSTEHPAITSEQAPLDTESTQVRLQAAKKELELNTESLRKIADDILTASTFVDGLLKSIDKAEQVNAVLQPEWQSGCRTAELKLDIHNNQALQALIVETKHSESAFKAAVEECRSNEKKHQQLKDTVAKEDKSLDQILSELNVLYAKREGWQQSLTENRDLSLIHISEPTRPY